MAYLTPEALKNAARRRRKSGQTPFHQAIVNRSIYEALEWTQHPECPFNRVSREGDMPLAAIAQVYHCQLREDRSAREPSDWWVKTYPHKTADDWRRESMDIDTRYRAMMEQIFCACLANTDWSQWGPRQVEGLLDVLPLGSKDGAPAGGLLWRIIEAGLPLDRLTYNDTPVTPGMYALLKHPYRVEATHWVEHPYPLDPSGTGPGFLSAALMQWQRGLVRDDGYWERVVAQAIERGCSLDRPVCDLSWLPKEDSKYTYLKDQYTPQKTLFAQAQALDKPGLLAVISEHRVNDQERISSLLVLMRRTGEVHAKRGIKENPQRQEEHASQLLRMLEKPPGDPKQWHEDGGKLIDTCLKHLWSTLPCRENPLGVQVRKRLMELGGDAKASRRAVVEAVGDMALHLSAFEITENRREAADDLARLGVARDTQTTIFAEQLTKSIMESEYRRARCTIALEQLLADGDLPAEAHAPITQLVFGTCKGIPVHQLAHVVNLLQGGGWTPSPLAWELLATRVRSIDGHDSVEAIKLLADVAATQAPVETELLFNPAPLPAPDPGSAQHTSDKGYEELYRWGREEALAAQDYVAHRAIASLANPNSFAFKGKSLLRHISGFMASQKETHELQLLDSFAAALVERGADPASERTREGVPLDWVAELSPSNPFHETLARIQRKHLDASTSLAGARIRGRRL